jgi:amino acid adenylation domain-containing protein
LFVLQNAPLPTVSWNGLEATASIVETGTAKFDLTLSAHEEDGELELSLEYRTELFNPERMKRLLQHYRTLLEGMAVSVDARIGELEMLSEPERQQLLVEWNRTEAPYSTDKCVHRLFEEQAAKTPQAVAVIYEEERLSYGELNERANRLAWRLRDLGVGPETIVGLMVERSIEMVVALLGVLKAGGAYVPMDPGHPRERLQFMVEDTQAAVVLTQTRFAEPMRGSSAHIICVEDEWDEIAHESDGNPEGNVGPGNLAYVIYTSGSTGQPKGVGVSHGALANLVHWHLGRYGIAAQDRMTQFATVGFDAAVWEVWPTLVAGASLYIVSETLRLDPHAYLQWMQKNQITISFLPTPVAEAVLKLNWPEAMNLRFLLTGGDQLHSVSSVSHEFVLLNHYGPTENTVVASMAEVGWASEDTPSIGRPIANTQIYVTDEELQLVPVGVAGELCIGGASLARGYLNRPAMTAEKFVPDPFSRQGGERLYRTGDRVRWLRDGTLQFLGRLDRQVKVRGFRIELGEVENALQAHPGIEQAVVLAREDAAGEKRLVAYYTASGSGEAEAASVGAKQLRAHLSAVVPDYMVPAAYVCLDRLPLTPNGKLDRGALPAPEQDSYAARGYEGPVGEMETKLAAVWAEVLKLEKVGRHDNFFELGGHSLLAVTLMERMRRMGLELDVRALFGTPTLAELAASAGVGAGIETPENRIPVGCKRVTPEMLPLVELSEEAIDRIVGGVAGGAENVQDIYPLAPLQEGMLFHHLLSEEGDAYVIGMLAGFDTRQRLDRYVEATHRVIQRHDVLRTAVVWEGLAEPVQVVWREARLPVEEVELEAGRDAAEQLYARFDPRSFRIDVRQAPLLRVYIAEDKEKGRWLMMMLLHHLVADHTTLEVMQEETEAYLLGKAGELSAPLPFRHLVAQARRAVSEEEDEAFFRMMLGDVEEPTAPFDLMSVQGDGRGLEEAAIMLEGVLARRVREQARKLCVSVASMCHVAWGRVLAKLSAREDVVFGTLLFGRMRGGAGADRVMGPFINTLPIRLRIGEEGVEASVRRTHRELAQLLHHEYASLALAQRCSGVAAPTPLFSALLNYAHTVHSAESLIQKGLWELRAWEGMEWLRSEERTNYPLALSVHDLGADLGLTAQVAGGIDPKRICRFMERALASLVEALETAPERAVRSLEVMPEEERRRVLYEWNDTNAEYPSDRCVQELFEEQVGRTPEATAVVYEDASLSYAELNRRANQLAHYLVKMSVGPEVRVGICMERGLETMVGALGVLKAGGAYVALDPADPGVRRSYMVRDAGAKIVLTNERFIQQMAGCAEHVVDLEEAREEIEKQSGDNLNVHVDPKNLAWVIYTSSSSGRP